MLSLDNFSTAFVAALILSCRRDCRYHACEATPATPLYWQPWTCIPVLIRNTLLKTDL